MIVRMPDIIFADIYESWVMNGFEGL